MAAYSIKFMFADAVTMECDFSAGLTVLDAKTKLLEQWPEGKDPVMGAQDIRMIHSGKVLEDSKTFEDYKVPMGQKVIMHLQPKPIQANMPVMDPPAKQANDQAKCCVIL